MISRILSTGLALFTLLVFGVSSSNLYADGETRLTGDWVKKGYNIKGQWEIVDRGDKTFLVLDDKFKTKKGPDLKIFLSKESIQKVKGKSVKGSSVLISELQSHKGAQEYEIPADINLDDFSSVLIHCEAFAHLWGGGALQK